MQKSMEMSWRLGELTPEAEASKPCAACKGGGRRRCHFCAGHGLIRAGGGDAMACPVCKTRGVEACGKCHGAGRIATWLLR
jgi:hypothetical protein